MSDIQKSLVREGIEKAGCLDDKLSIVARAVSRSIDATPEGILYEIEVLRALEQLRSSGVGHLRESDPLYLAKPSENRYYTQFGVKTAKLKDAIIFAMQEADPQKQIEVRYEGDRQGTTQQFCFKIIMYRDDEKLRQYIQSRTSLYPKVVYNFAVPDGLATIREGIRQRSAR